jgi:hypothetical protein
MCSSETKDFIFGRYAVRMFAELLAVWVALLHEFHQFHPENALKCMTFFLSKPYQLIHYHVYLLSRRASVGRLGFAHWTPRLTRNDSSLCNIKHSFS